MRCKSRVEPPKRSLPLAPAFPVSVARYAGSLPFGVTTLPLILLGLGFAGCNIEGDVGGLADSLLDPEPSSIDSPGRKIAEGQYTSLELDASLAVGARLLALRHDREETELAIIPFEGGKACHVAGVERFMRLASQVDINLSPIVSVLGDIQDGRGTLRFVDFNCDEVMPSLIDVTLPQVLYPRIEPTGFLALSGSGTVHFVDVEKHEVSTVAENVQSGRVGVDYLWLVEQGELLARDGDFEVQARYGTAVQDFALFNHLQGTATTNVAFIENGALYLVDHGEEEPVLLAEDVCTLTDIGHAGAFAFYSPCATRQLTLAYAGSLAGLGDDARVLVTHLSEQAIDPKQIDLYWGKGYGAALFVTNSDGAANSGTLMMQQFDAETGAAEAPSELGEAAHIGTGGVIQLNYASDSGTLMRVVIENDDTGRPELVSIDPLAEQVAQLPGVTVSSSLGVLTNFDTSAGTGDLVLFSYDLEQPPKVLAEDVPVQRHARDTTRQRSGFVGDFDGETGRSS